MDGHGDYSPLDRPRLLSTGLDGGANGSGSSSHPGGGGSSSGGVHLTVTELAAARAATPTTLTSLAQYQNRYGLPPSALPGSSYAIMSSFISGAHGAEARKAFLPDLQHYWSTHTESFPRYLMAGGLYPPYPPLFPPADSLSLLGSTGVACVSGGGAGPSSSHHAVQYQRIIEMHKDAYLASMSAVAAANHHPALYGLNPGGLGSFLEQSQASPHNSSPISLVKQEPKELAPTEKPGKHLERHSSLELDYSRGGREGAPAHSSHNTKGKSSPSATSSSPSSTSLGGKHDKRGTPTFTPSNSSHTLRKSSSTTSVNLSCAPRHQQEHLRIKCTSPAADNNTSTHHHSGPSKANTVSSPSNSNKKTKASSQPKLWKAPDRQQSTTAPAEAQPHLNVPNQASAPIPLATVQHDGVLLSALASPSSAAASSANSSKLIAIQQVDRQSRTSAGAKDAPEYARDATADRQLTKTVSSGIRVGAEANEPGASTSASVSDDRPSDESVSQDDSSDIVVDSTEETSHTSRKSEQDRAIDETIERVASATEATPGSGVERMASATPVDSGPCPSRSQNVSVPPVMSIVKLDATGTVSSSVPSGGTRTVCAKTLNIPSVTTSGLLSARNLSTQAPAPSLPFYPTPGVKRVHATTFVPEVGIFKGPSIKCFTKSSLPVMSTVPLEDHSRPDPKFLHMNSIVAGQGRTRNVTPTSPRPVSVTPDVTSQGGLAAGEISSSVETASVGSPSVRSVTSAHSLADREEYGVKEEYDEVSDDEANGLVIDDGAEEDAAGDAEEERTALLEPSCEGANIDSDALGDAARGTGENLPKRPCDTKLLDVADVNNCSKLSSKVPSSVGDATPCCDEAIDYSLPKSLQPRRNSSHLSGGASGVFRESGAVLLSVPTCLKSSAAVEKHGQGSLKNAPAAFRSFAPSASGIQTTCRKLLHSRKVAAMGSSKPGPSSCKKISPLVGKPDVLPASCHALDKTASRRRQYLEVDPPSVSRCGSAPPIVGSTVFLSAPVSLSKGHAMTCSKLSLDMPDRSDVSNEHSLGNNIPVGIAVAQIRPHHVQTSRDPQANEPHGRDIRLSSSSVKTVAQCSQATSSEPLPPNLVVTGGSVNPSSWLAQMPFTIHQALNTRGAAFGPTHYPVTPPSGFKFTQDSITGQIYLVSTGVEAGVWPHTNFTSSSGTGHPHFQTNSSLPSMNSAENKNIGLAKEETNPVVGGDSADDRILPDQIITSTDRTTDSGKHQAIAQQFISGKGLPAPTFTAATAATALVNPVTGHSVTAPFVDVKAGPPSVQSRGCSPVNFDDASSSLALLSALSAARRPSTCSVGIQTCTALSQATEPVRAALHDQGVQTTTSDLPTLNPLSVQCPDLDSVDNLTPKANVERSSYNPFTDPQILQAADGLELLSALAEKRPKCSSLDDPKRIYPSPSDSFKSDTASILAIDDTLSPGDTDLKSGQCTPRRDIRRDLSPKWSLPKKEPPSLVFGDFKTPSEMCADSQDVRVKMAEVQRQYKEKQKKLAKLQNKKNEESHQNKRGPGRPPKKKQGSKKSDDDSSSSSSKTKEHGQHQHKRKRPAEELVDRVFRKLPPVVKPCKVSRSIHYVKSKTGPFFKRKSASSSVKRNKDLFGFDESNWPSFSERKHQEKIKGSGVPSEKHKHKHSDSHSDDSKHCHVGGNIFESLDKDFNEKKGRSSKTSSFKHTKLSATSLLTIKTEPSFLSSQDSGLGLLAKFALTPLTTQLTSPTATLSSLTLASTVPSSTTTTTTHTAPVMPQLSATTFSSSSGMYGGLYSSIYHVTSTTTPAITFGSRSSLMSSANSGLMSFSSPGLSAAMKSVAVASPSSTSPPAAPMTSSLPQAASASQVTAVTWTASVSPAPNNSSGTEESSGTPCGSEASPNKRKHEDDSDTDTSESSPNKKRKPGRPKKINPDMSTGGTETIWAKKSSTIGLLQVSESNSVMKESESKKLDLNCMKPLFLDEEWTRRRSERIFLSETSPQPSPAISPSPRGEPVWKLSNFMPKSKKILDLSKSVKEGESKEQAGPALLKPAPSSSPVTPSLMSVVKTEESTMPVLSAFSWSCVPKMVESTSVKSESEAQKLEDIGPPKLSSSRKIKKDRSKESSKDRDKKKTTEKSKNSRDEESREDEDPPILVKKEKRAEEHSKIKLQKAKSLHDLTQRVKKKYSKANKKQQEEQNKSKKGKKKRKVSTDSSDNDNLPLSTYRDGPPTPEPRSCKLQTNDLREGLKVLYLNDGLFYEGVVKAIQPPDVYGVLTAGQRGSRPHILCQEEVLKDAVLDVRPDSIRHLPEGTRVCAFWSQQFSCLYPGTVAKSSPSSNNAPASVSVDFDDGDSGRIPIGHIRLLPSDFPIVEYEPDPLENLPKRRRQTTSEGSEARKPTEAAKSNRQEKKQKDKEEEEENKDEDKSDSDESAASSKKFWKWSGNSTKRPGLKGKAKKVFYRSISRGKEVITVGDSAVFVSTGRVHCPYIGRIESLWQGWNGQMMVKVQWYYHPEETQSSKKLTDPKNALFESHHEDENDVQTISHRCQVLSYSQFKKRLSKASKKGRTLGANVFYVAGFYDPSFKELSFYSGVS